MAEQKVTGKKQEPKKTKAQQIRELAVAVYNLQMAVRVMQVGIQQISQGFHGMNSDIGNAMGVLNDLQYRTLAMIEASGIDKDALEKVAEKLKLKDYNEASDKEDAENGYTVADVVESDSVVILTTTCKEDESKGVFRTKFKLDESANKEAEEKLKGLKVGDKTELKLGDLDHVVEVVGIRSVPRTEDAPSEEATNS